MKCRLWAFWHDGPQLAIEVLEADGTWVGCNASTITDEIGAWWSRISDDGTDTGYVSPSDWPAGIYEFTEGEMTMVTPIQQPEDPWHVL